MTSTRALRWLIPVIGGAVAGGALTSAAGAADTPGQRVDHTLPANTRFYVEPHSEAAAQAAADRRAGDTADAKLMAKLASWPEAIWLADGTPKEVGAKVKKIMHAAQRTDTVPVFVLYNIPGRDCSLYSAGGATDSAAYRAWVAAVAGSIGDGKAVVIVEPDGLAKLPSDCGTGSDPDGSLTAQRLADIKAAAAMVEAKPATSVYLDAGNSAWQGVGAIAQRLIDAGVAQTQGFSLNVSNYLPADQLDHYGTWVSKCVWFATAGPDWARGHADWCASQYYSPAAPNDGAPGDAVSGSDPSTWHWTDLWFDQNVGTPDAGSLSHFVVDTSRDGIGPWSPPAGTSYPDPQTWCNAPDRGVGARPTADTGVPLVDAYLYVKTIGESDGTCTRGTAGPGDPVYGDIVDPKAGAWWPDFAHTLARNASPSLTFNPAPADQDS